jgi:hypothetical protein
MSVVNINLDTDLVSQNNASFNGVRRGSIISIHSSGYTVGEPGSFGDSPIVSGINGSFIFQELWVLIKNTSVSFTMDLEIYEGAMTHGTLTTDYPLVAYQNDVTVDIGNEVIIKFTDITKLLDTTSSNSYTIFFKGDGISGAAGSRIWLSVNNAISGSLVQTQDGNDIVDVLDSSTSGTTVSIRTILREIPDPYVYITDPDSISLDDIFGNPVTNGTYSGTLSIPIDVVDHSLFNNDNDPVTHLNMEISADFDSGNVGSEYYNFVITSTNIPTRISGLETKEDSFNEFNKISKLIKLISSNSNKNIINIKNSINLINDITNNNQPKLE